MISGETKVRIQMCTTIWNVIMNTLIVREQLTLELRFAMVCMITRGVQMAQARSCSFVQKVKATSDHVAIRELFHQSCSSLECDGGSETVTGQSSLVECANRCVTPNRRAVGSNLCRGYVYCIKETA